MQSKPPAATSRRHESLYLPTRRTKGKYKEKKARKMLRKITQTQEKKKYFAYSTCHLHGHVVSQSLPVLEPSNTSSSLVLAMNDRLFRMHRGER